MGHFDSTITGPFSLTAVTTGRTFGGHALTLDQEDGLIGLALVLGAIAFDEHAGASVAELRAGGKGYYNILETTLKAA